MTSKLTVFGLFFACTWAASPVVAADQGAIGRWMMANKKVIVEVKTCNGTEICGNLVWLEKPNNDDGTPKLDLHNPSTSLRQRQLIGMPVIEGMIQVDADTYKGTIYSSDDGGTYRATAKISGDSMKVKGCWTIFCKDINFTRVP